jgi:hypothetical protein
MRLALMTLVAAIAAGCGAPTDPTPNRAPPTSGDYPPGPYGYGQGTIMGDLHFVGKKSDTPTDYSQLPVLPLNISDVRQTAGAKLILIDGAARRAIAISRRCARLKRPTPRAAW